MNERDKKFWIAASISILVVTAIAYFDIISMNSGVFGSPSDYLTGNYIQGWWDLFYSFVLILMLFPAICYYLIYRRDISESLAIFLSSFTLYRFGAADVLFFWIRGLKIPESLPWLYPNAPIGSIAQFLGLNTVTPTSLLLSVGIGIGIILTFNKILKDKF